MSSFRPILIVALILGIIVVSTPCYAKADGPELGTYRAYRLRSNYGETKPLLTFTLSKSKSNNVFGVVGYVDQGPSIPRAAFSGSYMRKSRKLSGQVKNIRDAKGKPQNITLLVDGKFDPTDDRFDLTISKETSGKPSIWYNEVVAFHMSDPRLQVQTKLAKIPDERNDPSEKPFSIAGSWSQTTESIGSSVWIIKDEGNGFFSAKESGLGGATATRVTWNGNTLRIEFDDIRGWAGHYLWTVDPKTKLGQGHLIVTRGRAGTYKSNVKG